MPRQQLIKIRKGSGAPTAADFQEAEPAWDSTNGRLYVKDAAGSMIEIGAGGGGGGGTVDYQEFTANGTWTKPTGCTFFYAEAVGGGGGGSSGSRQASGVTSTGGTGGAGGTLVYRWGRLTELSNTESVTVGAGGTGGAAVTTDSQAQQSGVQGGDSLFGSSLYAPGGTNGSTTGGIIRVRGNATFGAGFAGAGGNAVTQGAIGSYGPGGGGGGGNVTAAGGSQAPQAGGQGFATRKSSTPATLGGGGSGAAAGSSANGSDGPSEGDGGGGGGRGIGIAAGAGGNGAFPGGGGAGGGASQNGFNSGAGGSGGNGVVRVWCW